jgi:hypothetical protein
VLDPNGGVRAHVEVTADQAGHARLLAVAVERAPGRRVWALEGTGSYGAGLAAFLSAQASGWSRSTGPSGPRPCRRQERPAGCDPGWSGSAGA